MSLSVTYFMNKYYAENRFGMSADQRKGHDARTLVNVDTQALRKCLKDLRQYDYEAKEKEGEEADTSELEKRVEAFVSTYNNFVESAGELDDATVARNMKKIKKLSQEQEEAFAKIGITVQSNGSLKLDKDTLKEAGIRKINNVFGNETDYGTELERTMKKTVNLIRQRGIGMPVQKKTQAAVLPQPGDTGTEPDPDVGTEKEQEEEKLYEQVSAAVYGGRINYSI